MWFIFSFITALGAAFLYEWSEKFSEELAIVCLAVTLISIILTLISAPWPIHLLMLVLALLSYRLTQTKLFN